jgi:hypothetical protein
MLNVLDKIGDWNPQLFREIKGRLKVFNVVIVVGISLLSQLVLFLYQLREIPGQKYQLLGEYCGLRSSYQKQQDLIQREVNKFNDLLYAAKSAKPVDKVKITDIEGQLELARNKSEDLFKFLSKNYCPPEQIHMQEWWLDHWKYIFMTLSVVFVFVLLIAGTYLLINNLAQEERKGTLNFLRLTPQTESEILLGKILGVPILIYLLVFLALPLHFFSGVSANIAKSHIFSFYSILGGSCFFFFSAALLFGLVCRWLNGFQPWLGSGSILLFLVITLQMASSGYSASLNYASAWLELLSPFQMVNHLFPRVLSSSVNSNVLKMNFFYLPIGKNLITLVGLQLLQFGMWSYWIWEALKRSFRNQNVAILSKTQSYGFIACSQVLTWGFTLQYYDRNYCPRYEDKLCTYDLNYQIAQNLPIIIAFNLILLFGLLAILSPHRQTVQDWERYRHQNISPNHKSGNKSFLTDLLRGEKSPAIMAMAVNLVIVAIPVAIWMLIAPSLNFHQNPANWIQKIDKMRGVLAIVMCISLMLIYTMVAQMVLLMKNSRRTLWAIGIVSSLVILPPIILSMVGMNPREHSFVWMLTSFPFYYVDAYSTPVMLFALSCQILVLALLHLQLSRTIKFLGESATKALLRV